MRASPPSPQQTRARKADVIAQIERSLGVVLTDDERGRLQTNALSLLLLVAEIVARSPLVALPDVSE